MLESLHISNYALIDNIDIDFHQGFNIITGETGAGKSIILGALGLLLGGRADSRTIGNAGQKSVIEATFRCDNSDAVRQLCADNDIDWNQDDNALIMRRELSPSGRSRAFINDTPVILTVMQEFGNLLIDIHSQHQNQMLAGSEFQLRIIDAVAENGRRLEAYSTLYADFRNALRAYKSTKATLSRDRDNADFMEFQLEQLNSLDLKDGELQQLEKDREVAAEQTELRSYLIEATDTLSNGESNILDLLSQLQESCSEIEHLFDESDNITERLETVRVELTDISDTLSAVASSGNSAGDPDLEYIETRISDIRTQMRKHNVDTPEQLIGLRRQLQSRIDNLADSETILSELEHKARAAKRKAMEAARTISQHRQQAAEAFARRLTDEASPLGMKNLICDIDVRQTEMSATGIDDIEFRFAFNKNQTPTGISGAASGGEISRLMLSIKSIVADMFELPTIIFDEVDTGVSGDVASRMGDMMKRMSGKMQVITITHLPQVAARGDHHYKVYKEDDEHATHTNILQLSQPQRIDELALMLSGDSANDAARANAKALIDMASTKS